MNIKKTIKKILPNCIKRLINNVIHKHRIVEMLKKHEGVAPFDDTRYPLTWKLQNEKPGISCLILELKIRR